MRELDDFFFLKARPNLRQNASAYDQERSMWREALTSWISLAQQAADWKVPPFTEAVMPAIVRLSMLRRAEGIQDGKERSKVMQDVYDAFRQSNADPKVDKASEIMERPLPPKGMDQKH
jgi:hypothetical protein